MDCGRARELLEAYALGALNEDERAEVERHLEGCPDCRELAGELDALAHRLPGALAAASALRPPGTLRQQVLAGLDVAESRPARSRRALPRRTLVVALAAALPALAVGWALGFQQASARESDRRAALARMLGVEEIVFEVVDSRETEKAFLRTTRDEGAFARSYGKLYTRRDLRDVVAFVARLPEPPEGRAYHLWLTGGGRTKLAGVLTLRDGFGLLVFKAPRPGPRYGAALLTLQERGATAPAGVRVLDWRESTEAKASAAPART
jgi:hypothetical protein